MVQSRRFLKVLCWVAHAQSLPPLELASPTPPPTPFPTPCQLEASHRVLDLWLWLSFRFPDAWVGVEEVAERRAQLALLIDASIRSMGTPRWGRVLRAGWPGLCALPHSS